MSKLLKWLIPLALLIANPAEARLFQVTTSGSGMNGLSGFNTSAVAGDTAQMAAGTYSSPIYPRANGTSTKPIVYLGQQADPNAVIVPGIQLGPQNDGANHSSGDYTQAKWITSTDDAGCWYHLRGGNWYTVQGVVMNKIIITGTGNHLYALSRFSTYDSISVADGGNEVINMYSEVCNGGGGVGAGGDCSAYDRPNNNIIRYGSFTANRTVASQWHFVTLERGSWNMFYRNTFNLTKASDGYCFAVEHYLSSYNTYQENTFNYTCNNNVGTTSLWGLRDSSSYNRFVGNTVVSNGTSAVGIGMEQDGSASGSCHHNYVGNNTFRFDNPANAAYYIQSHVDSDTIEFNTIKVTGAPAFSLNFDLGKNFTNSVIRHNTFYTDRSPAMAFVFKSGASGTVSGNKMVSNIIYTTAANSSSAPMLMLPSSGVGIDSLGLMFSRGGNAAYSVNLGGTYNGTPSGGTNGTLGSGGGYGGAKTAWNTPRFTDSTYATFNPHLLGGSPASSATFQDGFAGAFGTASAPPTQYQIAAAAGSGGTINPTGTVVVDSASSKTFTITPSTGYHINLVSVDGVSVGAVSTYTFTNIVDNHTISAFFTINSYNITASAGSGGSISPSGVTAKTYGQNQTYTITPNTGYAIANVLVDGVSIGTSTTYTFNNIAANHTISATFSILTYTIAASSTAGGSITPNGVITVNYGDSQTFTFTADANFALSNVAVDGVNLGGSMTGYSFSNVVSNHTITASYSAVAVVDPCDATGRPARVVDLIVIDSTLARLSWTQPASQLVQDGQSFVADPMTYFLYRTTSADTVSATLVDSATVSGLEIVTYAKNITPPAAGTTCWYHVKYKNSTNQLTSCPSNFVYLRGPAPTSDPGFAMGYDPRSFIWAVDASYDAAHPWVPLLSYDASTVDTAVCRQYSRFNMVCVPDRMADSSGTYGRLVALAALHTIRDMNPNAAIMACAGLDNTYIRQPADSVSQFTDTVFGQWKTVRDANGTGWATGTGTLNAPAAPADSTHGIQWLWNGKAGYKGWYFLMNEFGGHPGLTTNNTNLAYKVGNTYPIVDKRVQFLVNNYVLRKHPDGTYVWDGIAFDLALMGIGTQFANDFIDYQRTGYATAALLDSAYYAATEQLMNQLRAACVTVGRPNFIVTANAGNMDVLSTVNARMCEAWPLQQGGTWQGNFSRMIGPPTRMASRAAANSQSGGEGWAFKGTSFPTALLGSHPCYPCAGGVDTVASIRAAASYQIATAALTSAASGWGSGHIEDNQYTWWFDELAVDTTTGKAIKDARYEGWLGAPLDRWYNNASTINSTDVISGYGAFENSDINNWVRGGTYSTMAAVSDTIYAGSKAMRVRVLQTDAPSYVPYGETVTCGKKLYATTGDKVTVDFVARANFPRPLRVVLNGVSSVTDRSGWLANPVWVGQTWRQYRIQTTIATASPAAESMAVAFWLGDTTGTIWLDNVTVRKANRGGMYIRRFAHGYALVNPYTWADTISLVNDVRNITARSGVSINHNNGTTYAAGTPIAIPAQSGRLLVNWNLVANVDTCAIPDVPRRVTDLRLGLNGGYKVTIKFTVPSSDQTFTTYDDGATTVSLYRSPTIMSNSAQVAAATLLGSYDLGELGGAGATATVLDTASAKIVGTTYYYSVYTVDGEGNNSCLSNSPGVRILQPIVERKRHHWFLPHIGAH